MKNSKKILAVTACSVAAVATMSLFAGCGGGSTPLVSSVAAEKVYAVYTFDQLKGSAEELTDMTVSAFDANGKALKAMDTAINSEFSGCQVRAGEDMAWLSTVGGMKLPAISTVSATTGVSVSFWLNGCGATDDWAEVLTCKYLNVHAGCLSFYDEDGEYVDNFYEGTGGTITEGYAWDCIVAPGSAGWTFVTLNFKADGGIDYYVNGVMTISKPADGTSNSGAVTIKEVTDNCLNCIKTGAFTFAQGSLGQVDDLIIAQALTAEEATGLYNEQVTANTPKAE